MRSAGLISIFYLFNCRVSVLWNTNESEWGVLTPSRFLGSACERTKAERLVWSFSFVCTSARHLFFFRSLNDAQKFLQDPEVVLLFGWVIIWFFFFFYINFVLEQDGPSLLAVDASQRSVIAFRYDFQCMPLKSVSFFFLSVSSIRLKSPFISILYFQKKRKDKIYKHHL